ncbi:MAG: hypothetical protein PHW77_07770, partial [Eubacteriales bacterium]|nr:hypothetical protein [Eubacteriales bacterium]
AIREDFEKAFMYYSSEGIAVENAALRMAPENMGGFYTRPAVLWYPLDSAAKIYPLSMRNNRMAVFRLSVYLKKDVVPELLQTALTFTIKRFPGFATTIKKGFFWHYLDAAKRRFSIEKETYVPCRPLDISLSDSQVFRVLYYNNRISVEFFHVLTDAAGGMVFLKTLTAEYLRLLGADIPVFDGMLSINATPLPSETSNDFIKAEKAEKSSGLMEKSAVQMSGSLSKVKPCRILHFKLDAEKLIEFARSKGVTVTAYMLSLMFVAGKAATDGEIGSMNIQVPVNLRKFYDSDTLRNFSLYCGIRLPISEITSAGAVLPEIKKQLTEKATKSSMNCMVRASVGLVRALSWVPLFIKNPVARLVYGFLGEKTFTNTLSNIGVVTLPPEMARHIDSFDFVLGTGVTNRAYCSMVTFGNITTFSVSKLTTDPTFEEVMFRLLEEDGLTPVTEGSEVYEG